ncbi:MAG: thioredoxin-disulfide reductase [Candidatus Marinimicrobia bacterium]|nr:thioredoxin-disulfide reductase [Candidatus Neomarinimicrobiota bacterium]
MSNIIDVAIIGGGSAGYTAAIYTSREGLKTVIFEKELTGGTIAMTDIVENYPGFPEGITGAELMTKFKIQAENFGAEFEEFSPIVKIEKAGDLFNLISEDDHVYTAKTVILATGGTPRKVGLEQEKKLYGRGISYCATCDGPFFKEKHLAVIGGGDAAVQEALYLTKFARKVTIIHRRDELRANKDLQKKAFAHEKVDFIWNSVIEEILGNDRFEGLRLKNVQTGEVSEVPFEGMFIFIGWIPNTDFVKGFVELNEEGYIITDDNMNTSVSGIYAAGDVRAKSFRQVSTAVGEATTAALSASEHIG